MFGTTRAGCPPMSRHPAARAYRPAIVGPARAVIRGATAATVGSAKCPASRSIQPGPGTQSLSTKATSSVVTWSRPVLRAADGPPLPGRRTSVAPWAAATVASAAASREPSSTTMTG